MDRVNSMKFHEFMQMFGNVVEQCPLAAATVWDQRPFKNRQHLTASFSNFIRSLTPKVHEGLLRLHPELGRKHVTHDDSEREQKNAGLLDLGHASGHQVRELNARYRSKMGFPFVTCVSEAGDTEAIISELKSCLNATTNLIAIDDERQRGVDSIIDIAKKRVEHIEHKLIHSCNSNL